MSRAGLNRCRDAGCCCKDGGIRGEKKAITNQIIADLNQTGAFRQKRVATRERRIGFFYKEDGLERASLRRPTAAEGVEIWRRLRPKLETPPVLLRDASSFNRRRLQICLETPPVSPPHRRYCSGTIACFFHPFSHDEEEGVRSPFYALTTSKPQPVIFIKADKRSPPGNQSQHHYHCQAGSPCP